MSRKKVVRKRRKIILDSQYHSPLLSKFIRMIMWDGKLSTAEDIVYAALEDLQSKTEEPGIDVFQRALQNVKPLLKVKARRVGGATYQIPIEVPDDLGWALAMRWLITAARAGSGAPMQEKLAKELLSAWKKEGSAYRKREETHKMAEANRAFAHYRV